MTQHRGGRKKPGGPPGGDEIIRVRTPRRGQTLGEVEQMLGNRRMLVRCTDSHTRLCRIPGKIRKRIWIKDGSIVLVEPWEVQETERGRKSKVEPLLCKGCGTCAAGCPVSAITMRQYTDEQVLAQVVASTPAISHQ